MSGTCLSLCLDVARGYGKREADNYTDLRLCSPVLAGTGVTGALFMMADLISGDCGVLLPPARCFITWTSKLFSERCVNTASLSLTVITRLFRHSRQERH